MGEVDMGVPMALLSNADGESSDIGPGSATAGDDYAERLLRLETARWKRVLDVQRPYRWNLRRLHLGRTLDVGCGIGRNLLNLGPGSVGVDHNAASVAICRERGLVAYTAEEFMHGKVMDPRSFDSLLVAHVLEHLDTSAADQLLRDYLPYLRPHARIVIITPQEAGSQSDSTHLRWVDHALIRAHAERLGFAVDREYSFPLPRPFGRVFRYNEFVAVGHVLNQG